MDRRDVEYALRRIEAFKDDPERAHDREDDLYAELLKAIASGECDDPATCADLALKSKNIKFPRWCA